MENNVQPLKELKVLLYIAVSLRSGTFSGDAVTGKGEWLKPVPTSESGEWSWRRGHLMNTVIR